MILDGKSAEVEVDEIGAAEGTKVDEETETYGRRKPVDLDDGIFGSGPKGLAASSIICVLGMLAMFVLTRLVVWVMPVG